LDRLVPGRLKHVGTVAALAAMFAMAATDAAGARASATAELRGTARMVGGGLGAAPRLSVRQRLVRGRAPRSRGREQEHFAPAAVPDWIVPRRRGAGSVVR
jgi:hypothetical protein